MGYSGKLELEFLGRLLLISAFFVVVVILIWDVSKAMEENQGSFRDYVCFFSNSLKHNVMHSFPSACSEGRGGVIFSIKDIEEKDKNEKVKDVITDEKQIADLIDKCWWMYGSGKWDLGVKDEGGLALLWNIKETVILIPMRLDYTHVCYAFSLEDNMSKDDLYKFMREHRRNSNIVTSVEDSNTYWNYIQKTSIGDGIMLDDKMFKKDQKLMKNKVYYIIFFDERHSDTIHGIFTFKDKILISDKADFGDDIFSKAGAPNLDKILGELEEFMDNEVIPLD